MARPADDRVEPARPRRGLAAGVARVVRGYAVRALAAPLAAKAALLGAATAGTFIAISLCLLILVGASVGQVEVGESCQVGGEGAAEIPREFLGFYDDATQTYKLGRRGPAILASIHKTESGFGENMGPSSAGAIGHMQFMPGTWAAYGVDANDDGKKDPLEAEDAIHAAARYLRASGAPGNWHDALFAYNHAEWYVEQILAGSERFEGICETTVTPLTGELGKLPTDRLERLVYVASWIDRKRYPYCWGGGHGPRPGPTPGISYCWGGDGRKHPNGGEAGLDCSGAVRWLLVLTGYRDPGGIGSGGFAAAFPRGRGRVVTIYSNAGHVFVHVKGRGFWGTTQANYRHGPGWIRSYPTAGFVASHPAGL